MIDRAILYCLKNRQLVKFLLVLATLTTLFFTMLPPEQLGDSRLYDYDKIGHFLIFFGWTLLFGLLVFTQKQTETKLILIFLAGSVFGVSIEVLQELLPIGRTMDVWDAFVDICGSTVAIVMLFWIKRRYLSIEVSKQLKKI